MRRLVLLATALALAACAKDQAPPPAPLGIDSASAFPSDRSLQRAEDGVILSDGRIVVADQTHGLRALNPDGSSAHFGRFAEAGYVHSATAPAGPNGVAFTPDRAHILVADIYTGAIWKVAVADESVVKIYQHAFGVNSAIEDETGTLWFTQSTENMAGEGAEPRMYAAIDRPMKDGALYRLVNGEAKLMRSGFAFANGLAIDAARKRLYVAETMADSVWSFELDAAKGALSDARTFASVTTPDNVKIGRDGVVYVASPIESALYAIDPANGAAAIYFSGVSPESEAIADAWRTRVAAGEGAISLFTPKVWGTLPGAVTSAILDRDGEPAYLGTLGDALVKLDASGS